MAMTAPSHRQLVQSLAEHFRGGDRVVWAERGIGARWMAQYSGKGLPAPDVFTIRKTFARRAIAAYEVKATRADFLRDLREAKWTKYLPYCNRMYFATPRGLVTKADIPAEAGWLTLSDKGWATVKAAPYRPDAGELGELDWLCLLFYLDGHKRRVRDLADRAAAAANIEHYDFARAVGEKVAQALKGAKLATRASQREEQRYHELTETACRCLGMSLEDLERSYSVEADVVAACSSLSANKRRFLLEVGRGLIDFASKGEFTHKTAATISQEYGDKRRMIR